MRKTFPTQLDLIGPVPKSWNAAAVKRYFSITLGKMLQSNQQNDAETEENYLRSVNLTWKGVDTTDVRTMWFSPAEKRRLALRHGDLLVSEGGDVGRACLWNNELPDCFIQNAINRVRPIHSDSTRFLYYWLYLMKYAGYTDAMVNRITIGHLTAEKLERFDFVRPPPPEQHRIVTYLDPACATIDGAIDAKRKQLETLDTLRKSIIHKAVTRGLDDSVELKDSGLEWIGKIPKHWRKGKIFRLCESIASGGTPTSSNPDYYGGVIPWVQTGDLNDSYLTQTGKNITTLGLESSSAKVFPKNTLLMAMYGATIGKLGILTFPAATNQACCAMNFRDTMDIKYMFHLFFDMRDSLIAHGYGGGQNNISQGTIKHTYVFFPNKDEQCAISENIDENETEIKNVEKNLKTQIETLEQYQKSLIHECVTGKRRITKKDLKEVQSNV